MDRLEERISDAISLSAQADIQQEADCRRESEMVASAPKPHYSFGGKVIRVHDGDTLIVQGADTWPEWWQVVAIRLLGIDAPELHDKRKELADLADKARLALSGLLPLGSRVTFNQVHPDKYGGRLLAVPFFAGVNCCEELLKLGLARPYDGHGPKPWGTVKQ